MLPNGTNKEEIKTVIPIKSRSISSTAIKDSSNVPNRSNRFSATDSLSTTTTAAVVTPPPKLSGHRPIERQHIEHRLIERQNIEHRLIERHQSSDSILTQASSLPPVHARRHSSQDRLGRFIVKSSKSKSSGTTNANVPIPLPPRPKVQKSSTTEKPKFKYSRSVSGPISPLPRRDSEQIVIEQVSLVNGDDRPKCNKVREIRPTEEGTPTKTKSTTKVILNRSRPLHRTVSYNSASSNSSVSSQATEETSLNSSSSSTESSIGKRLHRTPVLITHPRITAELPRRLSNNNNIGSDGSSDGIVGQWKERKREEKRLAERRAFLESQMRRLS